MADEPKPTPASVERAKRIHEDIERLKHKGNAPTTGTPQGSEPKNLRDIIHDRMNKLKDEEKEKKGE